MFPHSERDSSQSDQSNNKKIWKIQLHYYDQNKSADDRPNVSSLNKVLATSIIKVTDMPGHHTIKGNLFEMKYQNYANRCNTL